MRVSGRRAAVVGALLLLAQWLLPAVALGLTVSPSSSTNGSYTVSWVAPAATSTRLFERVGSGAWSVAGTYGSTVTSKAFSGKAAGTYQYKTERCRWLWGSTTCWPSAGPVSVTVTAGRVPDAPARPVVTAGNGFLSVSWVAPASNGSAITDYGMHYREWGGTVWRYHPLTGTATRTTIRGLTNGTTYQVQVRAWNAAGASRFSVSGTGTPTAGRVPDAPARPVVTAGNGFLSVSWVAPASNGAAITDYGMHYREWGGTVWRYHPLTGTATRTTITGLTNGTTYQVQVRAWNAAGASRFSVSGTGTPTAGRVPDAPARPTVTAGNGSLSVSWVAPASNGSAITDYDMHYRVSGGTVWHNHVLRGTATRTTITGLTNGMTYQLQVRAENAAGESPFSATAAGTPTVGRVPAAPARPTVTAGNGSLTVSWVAPASNGSAITDYDMHYRVSGGTVWHNHVLRGTATRTTITGLTNGVTYQLQVRAENAAGESPFSATATGTPTAGRVPDAPARPTVTAGNGSLTVSWVAPASNGSAITDYDMHYRVSGGTVWHNHVLRGTATRTTITGLTNGATYQLQVRAENAAGESPFSATATGTPTVGRVPAAPARPTVTAGNGSLTVSWVAPASNGSAITDYDMHYRVWGGTVWHNHVLRGTATRTTITGLTNGVTYQLQVRAENAAGESPFSATATGTLVSRGAITVSPSPSTDGSYTVRWTVPAYSTGVRLYEQVGSGAWAYVAFYGRSETSKAYTGKASGTYRYRTRQCTSTGGERACWDSTSAGPVSVTVQLPRPTASIRWEPATVDYGETATRIWDSAHATACTINDRPHATSGRWVAENRTAGTTNRLVCTGPGGTSETVTATLTVRPPRPTARISWVPATVAHGEDSTLIWDSTHATSCTINGNPRPPSGSWVGENRTVDKTNRLVCTGPGGTSEAAVATVTVLSGTATVPAAPAPVATSPGSVVTAAEQVASDKVGTLPGAFRVAESGAATYRIDLSLPAGTAGAVPPLGLSYHSQRGNGLLGVGWGLDGLSAITRCRQTSAQDGVAQPLTFTAADRFCLDGERLLLVNGSATRRYGAPDTRYRTEVDGFFTVTAKGGSGGQPDYFVVTRKDGSVATYGARGDHPSEHRVYNLAGNSASQHILTWALREVKDSVGNRVFYGHARDAHGQRLSSINYAYGDPGVAGRRPRARVEFRYEARDDDTLGYLAGYRLQNTQRLVRITVRGMGTGATTPSSLPVLRTYRLRYQGTTTHVLSRLAGVKECVGTSTTVCLPETGFEWSAPASLFKSAAGATLTLNTERSWAPVDFTPADLDGDGVTDWVWTEIRGDRHRIRYALANKATGALTASHFTNNRSTLDYNNDAYGTSGYGDNLRVHTVALDYNADGRMDLAVYSTRSNQTRVHLSRPQAGGGWRLDSTGVLLFSGRYRYADLNSDGLLDAYRLVAVYGENNLIPTGYNLEVRYLKRAVGQALTSARYYAYGTPVTLSVAFTQSATSTISPLLPRQWKTLALADVALSDVDGDGRADLVTWGRDISQGIRHYRLSLRRLEVFRQTDTGFVRYGAPAGIPLASTGVSPKGVRVVDLNQDGLSDLVYFVGRWYAKSGDNNQWTGDWQYRLSTGAGFTAAQTLLAAASSGAQAPSSPSLYDDNGDGYPDFLYHDVPNRQLRVRRWSVARGAFETGTPTRVRTTLGQDNEQYFVADMSGDGNGDLLRISVSGDTETLRVYRHNQAGRAHLMTSVSNGLGAETDITYESLSTTAAYVRVEDLHAPVAAGSTPGERRCFQGICWPVQSALADAAAFYTALNAPWADTADPLTDPVTATAGSAPVLELTGPLYVVTRVDSSAPTGSDAGAKQWRGLRV